MRAITSLRRDRGGGYALIEVMIALLLISLIAALAMPGFAHQTGPSALRLTALQIATILREDRTTAMRTGHPVTTIINAASVQGGSVAGTIFIPPNSEMVAPASVRFSPDGRTSGGDIMIACATARFFVSISPDTGAIRIAAR